MAKRILFLSHDASRTGSPLALLRLLEWLRGNTDWEATVVLGAGGDLQQGFEAIAPTFVWDVPTPSRLGRRLIDSVRTRSGFPRDPRKGLLQGLASRNFDAVFANSAATARLIPTLQAHVRAPLLCCVRELEYVLTREVGMAKFRAAQPFVKHYLADSEATRQNLIRRHAVAPADVTRVYECIPARSYRSEASGSRAVEARTALGIPADAYVLASGGSLHWRKGPDLFLQVGRRLAERTKQRFALLWVGGPTKGDEHARFCHEMDCLGLTDRVHVTGITDEPLTYLAAADVFLLTSREEPLGMIALEAGVLERPVVCFDHAGGMAELLVGDRGFVVPYADPEAMAAVVARLLEDPASAAATARRFADYVSAHHDIDVIAPEIRELIEKRVLT